MSRMQYTCSVAMGPVDQLVEIARTAEEVGFDSIALPDSLFYMEKQAADYPYTPDGSRMWDENTPWVDPLIAAGAMGAVTSTLRFYTNVMKLGSRNPLLLARQVGSVANLTNNRFGFGVGIGWAPEEIEWCGVPYAKRGKRVDEITAQGAAQASVGEFDHPFARLFDEQMIDPDITELVDDERGFREIGRRDEAVEQRRLASAQKAGNGMNGDAAEHVWGTGHVSSPDGNWAAECSWFRAGSPLRRHLPDHCQWARRPAPEHSSVRDRGP